MKPSRLIPIATIGSLCALTMVGIAPKVLSATAVDTELALIVDYSSPDFASVKAAHAALFSSGNFYANYVANGPTTQSIAVSFWVYADGVDKAVDWTLIKDEASAQAFGAAISGASPVLATTFTDLGTAIKEASISTLSLNIYDGVYKIFDLASNGKDDDQNGNTTLSESSTALSDGIDAINSISTTQVPTSVLPGIVALANNNGNPPGGVQGFSLTNLTFTPSVTNSSYFTALGTKFSKELFPPVTPPPPTKTPEPSALLSLLGLSFIPLVYKRSKKSID